MQFLWALEKNEYSVGKLAKRIDVSPMIVSQHLWVMKERGALLERKEEKQVFIVLHIARSLMGIS